MQRLMLLVSLIFAVPVLAHHEKVVGDGVAHDLFHSLWWVVLALVVYRGVVWLRNKDNK